MSSADDAFGLDHDVVVQQQDVVAAVLDGLVHAAGEPAGAAEVRLVDDPQLAAEDAADLGEARLRPRPSGCPGRREDLVDMLSALGFSASSPQVVEAEVGLVQRGDLQGDRARAGSSGSGPPCTLRRPAPASFAPATRSNQYQPPSPKGARDRSNAVSAAVPSTRGVSTRCSGPAGVGLVDDDGASAAASATLSRTFSTVVQRRQ